MNKIQSKYEEMYRRLFEIIPDSIFIADPDSKKLVDCNKRTEKLMGYSRKEILSLKVDQLYPKDLVKRTTEDFKKHAAGKLVVVETEVLTKNKKRIPVSINSAIIEFDGKPYVLEIFRDITSIKKAEEELRDVKNYLENLLNYANAPIIVWDNKKRITLFNKAFEVLTGYKGDSVLGRNIDILFPPSQKKNILKTIEKATKGRKWQYVDIPIMRKDKGIRIVLWNSANITDKEGRIVTTIAQGMDITERKKLLEKLENNKIRLDIAIEASLIGVWELNLIDDTSIRNLIHDQIFGYTKMLPEWGAKTLFEHIVPEDGPSVRAAFNEAMKTEKLYFECRIIWPDKSIHWITATGKVLRDGAGKPQKILGTIIDITKRKKTEEEIKESETRWKALVENSLDTILIMDMEGKIKYINRTLPGFDIGKVIGSSCFDYMPQETIKLQKDVLKGVFETGKTQSFEFSAMGQHGKIVSYSSQIIPLKKGEVVSLAIQISKDITKQKKKEEELKFKVEELEKIHKLTVGRELKMVDLKKIIKKLKEK